jgi:hypothetical protein
MALTEIEFDLTAEQHKLMGYPKLQQGQSLTLQLETIVLLAEPGSEGWYTVQKEPLPPQWVRVERGAYAFTGQIEQAEHTKGDELESAIVLVRCGEIPVRAQCAPGGEGRLPFGVWETRYLTGVSRLYGLVEEDFSTAVGEQISVIIWGVHRLVLTPGDPNFGRWHESDELQPAPFVHDRIVITARVHRRI